MHPSAGAWTYTPFSQKISQSTNLSIYATPFRSTNTVTSCGFWTFERQINGFSPRQVAGESLDLEYKHLLEMRSGVVPRLDDFRTCLLGNSGVLDRAPNCRWFTDVTKDNDLNVYLSCADAIRKFDKDGKLLFLDEAWTTRFSKCLSFSSQLGGSTTTTTCSGKGGELITLNDPYSISI